MRISNPIPQAVGMLSPVATDYSDRLPLWKVRARQSRVNVVLSAFAGCVVATSLLLASGAPASAATEKPLPSFTVSPSDAIVQQSSSVVYRLKFAASVGRVRLDVTGIPDGVTPTLKLTSRSTANLTLTTGAAVAPGSYNGRIVSLNPGRKRTGLFVLTVAGRQIQPPVVSPQPVITLPVLATTTVKGTVTYRDRSLIPVGSIVTVRLQDTARQDVAAIELASTKITLTETNQAPPYAFELTYTAATLDPNARLSISARIEVDGKLTYINTSRFTVERGSTGPVEVVVDRV